MEDCCEGFGMEGITDAQASLCCPLYIVCTSSARYINFLSCFKSVYLDPSPAVLSLPGTILFVVSYHG